MRSMRPLFLAFLFVVAFFYVTTHHHLVSTDFVPNLVHPETTRAGRLDVNESTAPQSFDSEEQNNINVYKRALPSVVNITTNSVSYDFFYGPVPMEGQGSGFIIDKEGHILTNFHVVANAREVAVTLSNQKSYKADVIGTDPSHDLAVIKISAPDLTPVVLGDSKNLIVGQKVYCIGNPFGLSGTLTTGIVSSLRSVRSLDGTPIDDAIQTDAAVNPGNSGGPMLNVRGEVIGINFQIATNGVEQSAGIGFAIPINAAKAVLNDLVTLGRVRRPSLGVVNLPISPEFAQQAGLPSEYGLLIQRVLPNGSADKAGLRGGAKAAYLGNMRIVLGGDLIVGLNGQKISSLRDLAGMLNNHKAGETVTLTVYRGQQKMDVKVTLQEAQRSPNQLGA
jgi:S1-C subfamily serine protease